MESMRESVRAAGTVCVSLVVLLCVSRTVLAEPTLYLGRDATDIDKYLHLQTVNDDNDCKHYLIKYGHFNCSTSKGDTEERTGEPLPNFIETLFSDNNDSSKQQTSSSPEYCDMTDDEYADALRKVQSLFGLSQTGVCDVVTKIQMSKPRCGNLDNGDPAGLVPSKLTQSKISANLSRLIAESWNRTHVRGKRSTIRQTRIASPLLQEGDVPSKPRFMTIEENRRKREAKPVHRHRGTQDIVRHVSLGNLLRAKRDTPKRAPYRHVFRGKGSEAVGFAKPVITWRLFGPSSRISQLSIHDTIETAFRMWSEVTPLKFKEQDDPGADIAIIFSDTSYHKFCKHQFEGPGGEIAHSWQAGSIHLDHSEHWSNTESHGLFLMKVVVHEIGHVLGLHHVNRVYSVMYSVYLKRKHGNHFELGWEDRKEVQKFYGVCNGQFHTIFDWVREGVDKQLVFNTYFFRKNQYWMYENKNNRTRYGDPLPIVKEWKGVPSSPDAAISYRVHGEFKTFFFKDEHVYKFIFDRTNDNVDPRYPMRISDYFGKKNATSQSIPSHIDAVWQDFHTNYLHFIKGSTVYLYDLRGNEHTGCCVTISKFSDMYPRDPRDPSDKVLTGNVDAVYFSFVETEVYFVQGEHVWKIMNWRHGGRMLRYFGEWYNHWYDICDVEMDDEE